MSESDGFEVSPPAGACPIVYRGYFEDRRGRVALEIENDGSTLRTVIRGVAFAGEAFDDLTPVAGSAAKGAGPPGAASNMKSDALDAASAFTLNRNTLCDCRINIQIPVELVWKLPARSIRQTAELSMDLLLGAPAAHGGVDSEQLRFALSLVDLPGGLRVMRSGTVDSFEDGFLRIQSALAPERTMRNCFSCGLSDYFPGGSGIFGELACFRNIPDLYARSADDKQAFLKIFDRRAGFVQETHICSLYRPR